MKEDTGFVKTQDGLELFYRFRAPKKPSAGLMLVHGYAEHSGRYEGVMRALSEQGIAVFAPDLRGHGHSARILADIESLDRVMDDLHLLHEAVPRIIGEIPLFLLGHSLGATLALLYSMRYPRNIKGLVLSAALVQLPDYASPFLVKISGVLARLFPQLPVQSFDYTQVSRDPEVIGRMQEDPFYYKGKIKARMGLEMLKAIQRVQSGLSSPGLSSPGLPLLILYGTLDKLVNTSDSEYLYHNSSSADKTLKSFPGLYHEILNEPEKQEVFESIIAWIKERID